MATAAVEDEVFRNPRLVVLEEFGRAFIEFFLGCRVRRDAP
jgi:hypothetical protein